MDEFKYNEGAKEYTEPVIEDYGTLQELTASGGVSYQDVPMGTPIGNATNSSTP